MSEVVDESEVDWGPVGVPVSEVVDEALDDELACDVVSDEVVVLEPLPEVLLLGDVLLDAEDELLEDVVLLADVLFDDEVEVPDEDDELDGGCGGDVGPVLDELDVGRGGAYSGGGGPVVCCDVVGWLLDEEVTGSGGRMVMATAAARASPPVGRNLAMAVPSFV